VAVTDEPVLQLLMLEPTFAVTIPSISVIVVQRQGLGRDLPCQQSCLRFLGQTWAVAPAGIPLDERVLIQKSSLNH